MAASVPVFVPTALPPQPVPTEVGVATVVIHGTKAVGLQITTPCGTSIFFLDVEQARQVAELLQGAAGGVVVVPKLPEKLNGHHDG